MPPQQEDCNHPLCNTELSASELTVDEVQFIMDCCVVRGILVYNEDGTYSLAENPKEG